MPFRRTRVSALALVLTSMLIAAACGSDDDSGSATTTVSAAPTTSSTSTTTTTVPLTPDQVVAVTGLCNQYLDLILRNSDEEVTDDVARDRYRELAASARAVDETTANEIAKLAEPDSKPFLDVGATIARCRALGFEPTAAQIEQLQVLIAEVATRSTTIP